MKTILKLAVVAGLTTFLSTSAQAQGGGRGMGGGLNLLSNKSVQKELKLSDEQVEKADKAATEQREKLMEKMQELRELEQGERQEKMQAVMKDFQIESKKTIADILKPEQAKRLSQITLQTQGFMAYMDSEVSSKLKLSDEQKSKLKDLQEEQMSKMGELREEMQNDREGAMKKMTELRKEMSEKAANLLTSEQKASWKEMVGEPFTIVQQGRRPGGN